MKKLITSSLLLLVTSVMAINVGDKAIDFQTETIDGKSISLSSYEGKKPVWLVFWATWCPNCTKKIPALKDLHDVYGDEIELIGVNVDYQDSIDKARKYIDKYEIPYKTIYSGDIAALYNVRGVPTQIIIDINGDIAYVDGDILSNMSDDILKKLTTKK